MADDPAAVRALVEAIQTSTVDPLQAQAHRFTGCSKLLDRFAAVCAAWDEGRVPNARQITDTVNELRIALRLLQDDTCVHLEYEQSLDGTAKTIDFTLTSTEGKRIFYDVKTVLPDEGDEWALYQKAKEQRWFAEGTEIHWDPELGGPELAHYAFAARNKFIEHSLDLEQRIRFIPKDGRTYFRMVFCGDNFRWHQTDLEDFADTYFGRRTRGDALAVMQKHQMEEKGWVWDRTISDFCFFQRGPAQPVEVVFVCNLEGPDIETLIREPKRQRK